MALKSSRRKRQNVVDFGCGSGIFSYCCAQTGRCKSDWHWIIAPSSIYKQPWTTLSRNKCWKIVLSVFFTCWRSPDWKLNIVMANILAAAFKKNWAMSYQIIGAKKRATFILSGNIDEQSGKTWNHTTKISFVFQPTEIQGAWVRLSALKNYRV